MERHIIIIGGPTASGKSSFALKMAQEHGGVVINADSMQVYGELPILTAQPPETERGGIPHLLYGFLSAAEACSAARWLTAAKQEIDKTLEQGKTPIVVGGTGLYLKCLTQGIAVIPEIAEDIRMQARQLLEKIGNAEFHKMLQSRDPVAAENLNQGDSQRCLRAWEVVTQTQVPIHEWQNRPQAPLYPKEMFTCYAVTPPRAELYKKCDARFLKMLEQSALEEVKALVEQRLDPSLPAMKALGVPELSAHLRGEMTLAQSIEKSQQSTRNYAKRQMTWFRNQFPGWQVLTTY